MFSCRSFLVLPKSSSRRSLITRSRSIKKYRQEGLLPPSFIMRLPIDTSLWSKPARLCKDSYPALISRRTEKSATSLTFYTSFQRSKHRDARARIADRFSVVMNDASTHSVQLCWTCCLLVGERENIRLLDGNSASIELDDLLRPIALGILMLRPLSTLLCDTGGLGGTIALPVFLL
jgi:hypothetical protein